MLTSFAAQKKNEDGAWAGNKTRKRKQKNKTDKSLTFGRAPPSEQLLLFELEQETTYMVSGLRA